MIWMQDNLWEQESIQTHDFMYHFEKILEFINNTVFRPLQTRKITKVIDVNNNQTIIPEDSNTFFQNLWWNP